MNRKYPLFLFDLKKKTKVNNYLNLYLSSLLWSRKEIEIYQFNKLKELINHAYINIPFYHKRFKKYNFHPNYLKTIRDIKKIPILTRQDIQENIEILYSKNFKGKIFKNSSSGTTGIPINYYQDIYGLSAGIAAGYLCWLMSGWNLNLKGLQIWGNPESIKQWNTFFSKVKRFIFKQKYYPSSLLNSENNFLELINLYNKLNIEYIYGYSSSIYSLAKYIEKNKIKIKKCSFIFTTAENLFEYQKKVIENNLGHVIDYYGCGILEFILF